MIILDTNIISEIMKPSPSDQVIAWLDNQPTLQLSITTISIAEITYGLQVLPKGKRRVLLEEFFHIAVMEAFKYRIVAFEEDAAFLYGKVMSHRKSLGKPLSMLDGQIAAMAHVHRAALATRNTKDFVHCDLELINPFQP